MPGAVAVERDGGEAAEGVLHTAALCHALVGPVGLVGRQVVAEVG